MGDVFYQCLHHCLGFLRVHALAKAHVTEHAGDIDAGFATRLLQALDIGGEGGFFCGIETGDRCAGLAGDGCARRQAIVRQLRALHVVHIDVTAGLAQFGEILIGFDGEALEHEGAFHPWAIQFGHIHADAQIGDVCLAEHDPLPLFRCRQKIIRLTGSQAKREALSSRHQTVMISSTRMPGTSRLSTSGSSASLMPQLSANWFSSKCERSNRSLGRSYLPSSFRSCITRGLSRASLFDAITMTTAPEFNSNRLPTG